MAEFLSPGIFIEEVNVSGQQVDAVGTSTMATLGWTRRGPTDEAKLVTSNDDFVRTFGEFTNDSRVPISVQAFFFNGGTRAYVVRVVPTDSVAGESCITEPITGEVLGTSDGTDPQTLSATMANVPLFKGSVDVNWRNDPAGGTLGENPTFAPAESETATGPHLATLANTPLTDAVVTLNWTESIQATETLTVSAGPIVDTDTVTIGGQTYTFNTVLGGADSVLIGASDTTALDNLVAAINGDAGAGTLYGTGTVKNVDADAAVTSPGLTVGVWAILGGTAGNSIATTTTGGTTSFGAATMSGGTDNDAKTATITDGSTVGGADAARISAASIDRDTGALSITFVARTIGTDNGPDADSITVDYESGGAVQTVTDDGNGAFTLTTAGGTSVAGTVDYATGEISVTWTGGTDIPFDGNDVYVDYLYCLWEMDADNQGSWSDGLILRIAGNENFFTYGDQSVADAGTYSKFDVTILLTSNFTGEDEVKETYEEIVFDDVSDALYFPDIINDNSDFVSITDTGSLGVPSILKGTAVSGEVLDTGDGTTAAFSGTLANTSSVKTSLVITYEAVSGLPLRTLVADVNGNITGTGLDITKTNTVNYATGAWVLNFLTGANAPAAASSITADYIANPSVTSVDYVFTGGSNGTLSGTTFDRTVFSSPILQAPRRGMFALDRVDEVMQLIIPDFAGDTTVMGDQIDYAENRLDIFNIFTTPKGFDAQEAKDFKTITFTRKSKFAAMYWPWVRVTDPTNAAKILTVPPLGWVAGVYSRTDSTRNVGKAPGGTVDGALRFLTGLEKNPDKGERDTVYPVRINPLINTTQTGLAVWGVRTMSSTNDVLRYINAVRLFQFVEKSIFNSTFGFVFESISSNLYSQIKTTIDGFLLNLFNTGHFAGVTPDQSFFVICDGTNNPPEVANLGQVVVDIGIAPNRPGEFIRFRFSQKTLTA